MSEQAEGLTIGEVARQAGIKTSTVRYYESLGVLPEPERVGGRRRYDPDVLRRLAIVDIAQRAGFSLEEIRDLLDAADEPASQRMRALAQRKLPEIEALIARAQAVHRWLQDASACQCETFDACGLFDEGALDYPGLRASAWAPAAPSSSISTP
jgi:MerR family redox-sensitive transcriptional activator SoxR